MKYADEMVSSVMICKPNFIRTGSGIQKSIGGGILTHTHRQGGDHISPLLYPRSKEHRLKVCKLNKE
jgi:galactose-1-phosphate uridylyltransferase